MTIKTETVEMKTAERTWRINIEMLTDPMVTAHRETLRTANGEVISKEQKGDTQRSVSESGMGLIEVPGTTAKLTLGQLVSALVSATNVWSEEDAASLAATNSSP